MGIAALVALGIVALGNVRFADLWIVTVLLLLIGVAPPAVEVWRGTFDPLSLRNIFVLVYLLEHGFRAVYVLLTGEIYYLGSISAARDQLFRAQIYSCIGLLAFYFAYAFVFPPRTEAAHRESPAFVPKVKRSRVKLVVLGSMLCTLLSALWLFRLQGGFRTFLLHVWDFRTTDLYVGAAPFLRAAAFVTVGFLIYFAYSDRRIRLGTLVFLLLIECVAFLVAFRYLQLFTVGYLLVVRHYGYRRIRFHWWYVLLALAFALVNSAYVEYRYNTKGYADPLNAATDIISNSVPHIAENSGYRLFSRYRGWEILSRIVDFTPRTVSYCYGIPHVKEFGTLFIPRLLWPSKPRPVGLIMNAEFFWTWMGPEDYGGPPSTFIGELYWMGGTPVLLAGCILTGTLLRRTYAWMLAKKSPRRLMVYAVAGTAVGLLNESFNTGVIQFMTTIVQLLPCVWWIEGSVFRDIAGASESKPTEVPC